MTWSTTSFLGVNAQVTNPGLVSVTGWQTGELAAVAQAVQRSADGSLYATREATAQALVDELWATTTPSVASADPASGSGVTVVPAATTASCGTNPGDGADDGEGPGAWGGWSNGQIPPGELCAVSWDPSELLRCDAAAALETLDLAYVAAFGGLLALIVLAYRSTPASALPLPGWAVRLHTKGEGMPYGLAITAGALAVYPATGVYAAFTG